MGLSFVKGKREKWNNMIPHSMSFPDEGEGMEVPLTPTLGAGPDTSTPVFGSLAPPFKNQGAEEDQMAAVVAVAGLRIEEAPAADSAVIVPPPTENEEEKVEEPSTSAAAAERSIAPKADAGKGKEKSSKRKGASKENKVARME